MKAEELRIGNWVNDYGDHWQITLANFYTMYLDDGNEFEPIPLTEEWLVKFGFEHKSSNEYVKDRFVYRKRNRDLVINGFEYDYNGIIAYPEYVHQLQNLYFALTGEELQS